MAATGHVVLIGLMGSGKTTIGTLLAARLGRRFLDNDEALFGRFGRSARQIEATAGFDALHRDEALVLAQALADRTPAVIAAAAGAVLEPEVAEMLADSTVVYLRAAPDVLARRVAAMPDDDHRPFGNDAPEAFLRAQFDARDATYRALATLVVETASASAGEIVERITAAVALRAR